MVNNLAEKVECPLDRGCYVLFVHKWEGKKCLLYGVAGYVLIRGLKVYRETFRIARYIISCVSTVEGCPPI